MIHKVTELDKASLKVDMRKMYQKIGYMGAQQCLYEILESANILLEVINEELKQGNFRGKMEQ
jgi:hypothetical protein